ncbi:hypothetical protein [Methanorbis furvi]|uniref:Archaeal Type IV pilin N-terminal domain-containing protein n=1 Tax=Methanorbis furvi TaxID=3028299 RepID=A0AAE4SAY7_9EURY|nr:hypothetical protein [Methanocorpusculaceae archaeon Ag1]
MAMRKPDEGISEVISFVLILAMLILAFTIWTLYAVPAGGERMEEIHTANIQMQFSDFKSGVENVWIANSTGVVRESVFMLGPDVSESGLEILSFPLTKASGTLSVTANTSMGPLVHVDGVADYWPVVVRYSGKNVYTSDLTLEYSGYDNSVKAYGPSGNLLYVLPGSNQYKVLVPEGTKSEISGNGRAVIEYRLVGNETNNYLYNMGVRP